MLTNEQMVSINNILKNKTFKYDGYLFANVDIPVKIDYTIQLDGYKTMYSNGNLYHYLKISVKLTKFYDNMSKIIFGEWSTIKTKNPELAKEGIKNLYYFNRLLEKDISFFTKTLGVDKIIIDDIDFDSTNTEKIVTEGKMSRRAIRQVVRDITFLLKKNESGFFYLPEDIDNYSFTDLPFDFNVELTLKKSEKFNNFSINAHYVYDEYTIEILIIYNPFTLRKNLYDIIGELNDIIAHELEHTYQNDKGEDFETNEKGIDDPYEYFSKEYEITPQYKGFKRLSKLRKEPIEKIVRDWFESRKSMYNLTDEQINSLVKKIINPKN